MMYDDLIETARKRMSDAYDADLPNREEGEHDMLFLTGENQWPEEIRREREADGKPCLTINWMPQLVRQVTGQARQVNPAIKVLAADKEASEDVADIYEGLIRQIEYASDAASVYEGAAESAAMCGVGYFRILTEYEDHASFNQEILVKRIHNPWSVYMDPYAKETHRGDAEWCFITEAVPKEVFEEMYPDAKAQDVEASRTSISSFDWFSGESVTVAEYYWKEYDAMTLYLAPGGVVTDRKPKGKYKMRKVRKPRIMWAKINGCEILEGPERVAGEHIPVLAVTGEEIHLGDTVYRSSVIRFAKDPQQILNYTQSAAVEMTALQPKAPWLLTPAQVKGFESYWAEANSANRPYLPYNPDPQAPAPMRVQPPVSSQGLMDQIGMATQNLKDTTGVHDANLGKRSNETSGVAIRQRQAESQNATSIYVDNMAKAVAQCGRVIVSMIPEVYDTERVIRILGPDSEQKMVPVNGMQETYEGPRPVNDLTVGKYDIRISVGPSYSTRRQEAADGMREILQAVPIVGQVAPDLVVKMQDWPEADRMAERLKKSLPPGLIGIDEMPEEEQEQAMQAAQEGQQQAQAQMQAQMQMQQITMAEAAAKAKKAEAEAHKAEAEAQKTELEVAQMSGRIEAAIAAARDDGAANGRASVVAAMVGQR